MRVYERFLRYARISTASDDANPINPSTARQFDLANLLVEECRALGLTARVDEHCYVYAEIPPTPGYEACRTVGFVAHMDTSPDFSGEGVSPRLIPNYDGGDVVLGDSGRVLSVRDFPHLPTLKGRTLIVTDGTALLGADDKSGIAEIMTLAEMLARGDIPHGRVVLAFTPDEEIGMGTANFDIPGFGADFAYTLDGGEAGEVVYENFNAAAARFDIRGVNVHPGEAKGVMVNAALLATEINAMLPAGAIPAKTEGREGFFHLTDIAGDCEAAHVSYIIRDHDKTLFDEKCALCREIEGRMNAAYGAGTVTLTLREQYRNMREAIGEHMDVVELAISVTRELGLALVTDPIRGGTDGATLSNRGLPCPNLGTGGYAFHGPFEHITAEGMENALRVILGIVRRVAEEGRA